jgi:hypothetical protein
MAVVKNARVKHKGRILFSVIEVDLRRPVTRPGIGFWCLCGDASALPSV